MDEPYVVKVLFQINELIKVKKNLQNSFNLLGNSKSAGLLNFKIRSYLKWINKIKSYEEELNLVSCEKDIKQFKFTPSLQKKLIEIFNNNSLQEIEDTQKEIESMTSVESNDTNINNDNSSNMDNNNNNNNMDNDTNNNSDNSDINSIKKKDGGKKGKKSKLVIKSNKRESKNQNEQNDNAPKLEISINKGKNEKPPPKKKKNQQKRPTDELGQKIYDLQKVTGFGPKTAEKMVKDNNINLHLLLKEWGEFCSLDPNNHIINPEKLNAGLANPELSICSPSRLNRMRHKIIEDKFRNTSYLKHLNHHQLVGIKYYHDINLRIPRSEIEKIEQVFRHVCKAIDPDLIVEICGSYRRGRSNSGDVDTLIAHPKLLTPEQIKSCKPLSKIVQTLSLCNFLVDHLTNDGDTKYMGMGQLKGFPHARRVDIRFVPYYCFAPALLYFTGSMTFNTKMRNHALSKGYSLSEYGLRKMEFDKKQNKEVKGPIEIVTTEKDVFKFLDYPYSTPEERDI